MKKIYIKDVRTYITSKKSGGDYHLQEEGHWISDTVIANPMSPYPEYKQTRTSWGIGVLGSVIVEIELSNGCRGVHICSKVLQLSPDDLNIGELELSNGCRGVNLCSKRL